MLRIRRQNGVNALFWRRGRRLSATSIVTAEIEGLPIYREKPVNKMFSRVNHVAQKGATRNRLNLLQTSPDF